MRADIAARLGCEPCTPTMHWRAPIAGEGEGAALGMEHPLPNFNEKEQSAMADPEKPALRNRPTDDAGISVFGIETHAAEKSVIIMLPAFGEAKEDVFIIVSPKYARLLGKKLISEATATLKVKRWNNSNNLEKFN
jgi:hypothetical protein